MEEGPVLDTGLLIEGQTGLTTIFSVVEYPKVLEREGLGILWPVKDDFLYAVEVMIDLLKKGRPIPSTDVLIASMCLRRRLELATKDRHFKEIQNIRPELKLSLP